ncbi:MAG: 50S ribosome-binding GTPase [Chloroflexi bacterium]|nr:50S ribosome-binding GTPase [Chloroflexota bacterium]
MAPPGADLLRLSTAGSVDDGKSTLIGRLLYETREVFDDQLAAVERASRARGADYVDLALLTDGLRAEREQGITIDVAYRHFATAHRRFILADTPGHVQYTRNMVTGTSTADVTVVLLDARKGATEQTHRHLYVAAMLRVPRVIVCVNKLDLVGFDEVSFLAIQRELTAFAARLGLPTPHFIPISALLGDNVVRRSGAMAWYDGPTLLEDLEQVPAAADRRGGPARLPVQWVVRPHRREHHDYRGYAGQLASGELRVGDLVIVQPAGLTTRVAGIDTFDGPLESASAPASVVVQLRDQLDVARGDLIGSADMPASVGQELDVLTCWFSTTPLRVGGRYLVKHTTRTTRALVQRLDHAVDVNTGDALPADTLNLNDIGVLRLKTLAPLAYDAYAVDRSMGSLILIDEASNETLAAGVIS